MQNRVVRILRGCVSKAFRKKVVKDYRQKNSVKQCTIISSNCIGGILSHDLGLRFDSPTVNLWFEADGFVRFLENLTYYIDCPLHDIFWDENRGYPVGRLGDIKIYFQHYHSVEKAKEKWETRCKRVDMDNLCVICTDRDGMTLDLLQRYLKLPYKKIIYVGHKAMVLNEECIYIPGFENENQLPDMSGWADWKGHRYYEKYFDIVEWLNGTR